MHLPLPPTPKQRRRYLQNWSAPVSVPGSRSRHGVDVCGNAEDSRPEGNKDAGNTQRTLCSYRQRKRDRDRDRDREGGGRENKVSANVNKCVCMGFMEARNMSLSCREAGKAGTLHLLTEVVQEGIQGCCFCRVLAGVLSHEASVRTRFVGSIPELCHKDVAVPCAPAQGMAWHGMAWRWWPPSPRLYERDPFANTTQHGQHGSTGSTAAWPV